MTIEEQCTFFHGNLNFSLPRIKEYWPERILFLVAKKLFLPTRRRRKRNFFRKKEKKTSSDSESKSESRRNWPFKGYLWGTYCCSSVWGCSFGDDTEIYAPINLFLVIYR